jgi:hypothetical protein
VSTFTQTYCDLCNYEHEIDYSRAVGMDGNDGDTWCRAYMPEDTYMGGMYGWATFVKPEPGRYRGEQMHVCAGCLANPAIDLPRAPWEPELDEDRENVEKGQAARERFEEARELLGTWDERFRCWRGVRQKIGRHDDCWQVGPRPKPVAA